MYNVRKHLVKEQLLPVQVEQYVGQTWQKAKAS